MPSTPPPSSAASIEAALRASIADRMDETRRRLEKLPSLEQRLTPTAAAEVGAALDACCELLAEIVDLNAKLRNLEGLSIDGTLGSDSVEIAVLAAVDTVSRLRSRLEDTLAA